MISRNYTIGTHKEAKVSTKTIAIISRVTLLKEIATIYLTVRATL